MKKIEFFNSWSSLHGGAEIKGIVRAWLEISFLLCKPLAVLRVTPNSLSIFGLLLGINLVDEIRAKGSKLDIYPGILPITNFAQLKKMSELAGSPIPSEIQRRVEAAGDTPADVVKVGVDIASELSEKLLDYGVPGLHFYTMNSAAPTIEIIKRIGLR